MREGLTYEDHFHWQEIRRTIEVESKQSGAVTLDIACQRIAKLQIAWTQELPTVPGLYLRNNPPASAILFADIVETDGVLRNYRANVGVGSASLKSQKGFWWFGPIPVLDKDQS